MKVWKCPICGIVKNIKGKYFGPASALPSRLRIELHILRAHSIIWEGEIESVEVPFLIFLLGRQKKLKSRSLYCTLKVVATILNCNFRIGSCDSNSKRCSLNVAPKQNSLNF